MTDPRPVRSVVEDHVILVEADGTACGLAPRASVHTAHTPLHLAFSCYVLREDGRVLLTRRALSKHTWPGVWTNSFCGHPRRELGMEVHGTEEAIGDFRYRAVDASGIVENEICPVFVTVAATEPSANPAEVMDLRWVTPAELRSLVELSPWTLSPWTAAQVPQLRGHLDRVAASTP